MSESGKRIANAVRCEQEGANATRQYHRCFNAPAVRAIERRKEIMTVDDDRDVSIAVAEHCLPEAEEAENGENDHDGADKPYNVIHALSSLLSGHRA